MSIRTLFMMLKGSKTELSLLEYLVRCLQTARKTSTKVTVLTNNLDELITRDPSRFLRSMEQEMNISEQQRERWCRRMDQIAGNCYYIFQLDCAPAHNNKRPQVWLKESLTEVCEKEI